MIASSQPAPQPGDALYIPTPTYGFGVVLSVNHYHRTCYVAFQNTSTADLWFHEVVSGARVLAVLTSGMVRNN